MPRTEAMSQRMAANNGCANTLFILEHRATVSSSVLPFTQSKRGEGQSKERHRSFQTEDCTAGFNGLGQHCPTSASVVLESQFASNPAAKPIIPASPLATIPSLKCCGNPYASLSLWLDSAIIVTHKETLTYPPTQWAKLEWSHFKILSFPDSLLWKTMRSLSLEWTYAPSIILKYEQKSQQIQHSLQGFSARTCNFNRRIHSWISVDLINEFLLQKTGV